MKLFKGILTILFVSVFAMSCNDGKKECEADCKKECCVKGEAKTCEADCKKACCADKNKEEAKACESGCKKKCCADKIVEEAEKA